MSLTIIAVVLALAALVLALVKPPSDESAWRKRWEAQAVLCDQRAKAADRRKANCYEAGCETGAARAIRMIIYGKDPEP